MLWEGREREREGEGEWPGEKGEVVRARGSVHKCSKYPQHTQLSMQVMPLTLVLVMEMSLMVNPDACSCTRSVSMRKAPYCITPSSGMGQ